VSAVGRPMLELAAEAQLAGARIAVLIAADGQVTTATDDAVTHEELAGSLEMLAAAIRSGHVAFHAA
jgi:hypothetical protein